MAEFVLLGEWSERGLPATTVRPDATCLILRRGVSAVARLSIEFDVPLAGVAGRTAVIGHYEAVDGTAGVQLLREAQCLLAKRGGERAIGPMNGNTWRRYRFVLPPAGDGASAVDGGPFLGEPWNRPDYPAHFRAAGFRSCASYHSRVVRNLAPRDRAPALAARLSQSATIRTVDPARFREELTALFPLVRRAFASSPFSRPIGLDEFLTLFLPLQPVLDPELALVAENRQGQPIAFALAYADVCPRAGGQPPRVVLKTVAADPKASPPGAGAWLADEIHHRARSRGCSTVIHALMRDDGNSARISRRYPGEVLRRYVLYEWSP